MNDKNLSSGRFGRSGDARRTAAGGPETGGAGPPAPAGTTRVMYVNNTSDHYGASRSLVRIVRNLDPRKYTPVVVIPDDGPLRETLEGCGVAVVVWPGLGIVTRSIATASGLVGLAGSLLPSALGLRGLMRRLRVDIVHTNTAVIMAPALAARLAGVPHVWHVRETFAEFGRLWPFLSRFIRATSRRVIANSRATADQFPPGDKVVVVNNSLDVENYDVDRGRLRAEFRRRHGLADEVVVGCVGRIKYLRKGQEFLVRAVALLRGRGLRVKALVVGSPFPGNEDHLVRLSGLIESLGVRDDVVLTGDLDDVRPAYAAMDMLALPSALPEPFGMVILEAMAMHLPVIATNGGGPADIVVDGQTGLLVPPTDVGALADAIARLALDERERLAFGAAGRRRLESEFALGPMMRSIQAVYQSL
jgi:glycosyltransferase involved in cell wall biosynthesis